MKDDEGIAIWGVSCHPQQERAISYKTARLRQNKRLKVWLNKSMLLTKLETEQVDEGSS